MAHETDRSEMAVLLELRHKLTRLEEKLDASNETTTREILHLERIRELEQIAVQREITALRADMTLMGRRSWAVIAMLLGLAANTVVGVLKNS